MDLDWTGSFQLNPFHTLEATYEIVFSIPVPVPVDGSLKHNTYIYRYDVS